MELQGPSQTEVKKIIFSNKGTYLSAAWRDNDICRIYSLHKQCQFTDISHPAPVSDISFDHYGGYLLTSAANRVEFHQYRAWNKTAGAITLFEPSHNIHARFSASAKSVFATSDESGNLKVFRLKQ